jgi:hypothetical protein
MYRIDKYIETLVAERARVDGEIARLEGIVRGSQHRTPTPRRKTGRQGLHGLAAVSIASRSSASRSSASLASRQSADHL